ncbi:CHAT domain-containing protein [Aquincola sp. J276]|uniref:CHAT domain-containing tetratricopeptide repeat protein n=1 Tax=Aquincola sp. J276 TaxID=2898432 RepID=UPI002150A12B|nr:CHAT domain-containing protein [Aquincola sp. J276]MCR5864148.1 CHAT domain-containing protein [Aquincola sp. J276]
MSAAPAGEDAAGQAALATAWALKAECYAAWSSEPPRALAAAAALQQLLDQAGPTAVPAVRSELQALCDWTAGIACLIDGRMAEALQVLGRAGGGWQALGQPLQAARVQVPQIMALAVLGRFDDAQALALQAEAALHAGGDELAAAKVRLNQGSLAFSRDDHAGAVAHYRAAAVRFARAGDPEHSVMADIGLADAMSYLGRFDEAGHFYNRARLRAQAHGQQVLAASAANGSALLALAQGRYREALAGLEATRRDFDALGLVHRRIEAEKSVADAYLELRLLPEAIALYTGLAEALALQDAQATLPWVQAQLARAWAGAGQPAAALRCLAEAAAGFAAQGNAAGQATAQAIESQLRLAAGDVDAAVAAAQQAVQGFEAAGLVAHAAAARVQAAAARGRAGDAAAALAECQALLADATLPPQVRARARAESAQALLALGRRAPAQQALEAAIAELEDLRAVLPGEDFQRAFLADALQPYLQRLRLALQEAQPPDGPGVAEVLHWLDRFKARSLLERLGGSARPPLNAADDEPLRQRLDWLYRREQRLVEDDGESPQALRTEAAALEQRLLEGARRQRLLAGADAPTGAAGDTQAPYARPGPLDVAALQAALGPQRVMVCYGIVDDELLALVLRHDGLRLHRRLCTLAPLQAAVRGLQLQVDALRAGQAWGPGPMAQLCQRAQGRLQQLHALVWAPLAASVADCRRLLVVPHGPLHELPFAALHDGTQAVVDRHDITLAASAGVALHALQRAAAAAGSVATAPGHCALLLGDATRLPHVARELQAVTDSLGWPQVVQAGGLGDTAAAVAVGQAELLHLACHGRFRADSPLFSALYLEGGALTADQVQQLQLRARLVVLSACETGLGEPGATDEGVGLVRAFLMAGARQVLASPWAVDDAASADFMAAFYRRWAAGQPADAALADAQRALRAQRPHPAHWAAFRLYGVA